MGLPAAISRILSKAGQKREQRDVREPGDGSEKAGGWGRLKRRK